MADPKKPEPTKTPRPTVNPAGKAYHDLKDDGCRWQVAVDALGGHKLGSIVGILDLQPGAEIQRVVDLGYLIPLSDEQAAEAVAAGVKADPVAYASHSNTPPKPEISPAPALTLADAIKADDARKADAK